MQQRLETQQGNHARRNRNHSFVPASDLVLSRGRFPSSLDNRKYTRRRRRALKSRLALWAGPGALMGFPQTRIAEWQRATID